MLENYLFYSLFGSIKGQRPLQNDISLVNLVSVRRGFVEMHVCILLYIARNNINHSFDVTMYYPVQSLIILGLNNILN